MEDDRVFSILSKCFLPIEENEWDAIIAPSMWGEFLDGVRCIIQYDRALGVQKNTLRQFGARCPLQEFISSDGTNALFLPPGYHEKQLFFARYFTGGLPKSVVPVESLYSSQGNSGRDRHKGLYRSASALYMEELIVKLGMEVPQDYSATPDHLALELDITAVLLRSGREKEACQFFCERFEWLTAFRMKFLELGKEAVFYIGLVDILLGIRIQQKTLIEREQRG